MTFSQRSEILWQYEPIGSNIYKLDLLCHNVSALGKNHFTHIYDAIKSAVADVKRTGNISLTNFVLITDGIDFKSETQIEEILQLVKDINIIILTIDVKNTTDLKRICDSAKSGRLFEIGDDNDYGFGSFDNVFSKTKDLIMADHKVSFINIKKEFDL
jgi:hypothetical protein